MKTKYVVWIVLGLGLIFLISGYLFSPQMGPVLATHWNASGEADGYGSPFMGLYFLPLFTMALSMMILFIPKIDPLKKNVSQFQPEYNLFVVAFALFMYYIHGLSLAWNMDYRFNMNGMMAPAFGVFFILTGWMMGRAKRNYFIGIRTPWTLADETVWDKTHNLGGKLFMASGVLTMACVFDPDAAIYVLLITALGSAAITTLHSYLEYRKIEKDIESG